MSESCPIDTHMDTWPSLITIALPGKACTGFHDPPSNLKRLNPVVKNVDSEIMWLTMETSPLIPLCKYCGISLLQYLETFQHLLFLSGESASKFQERSPLALHDPYILPLWHTIVPVIAQPSIQIVVLASPPFL